MTCVSRSVGRLKGRNLKGRVRATCMHWRARRDCDLCRSVVCNAVCVVLYKYKYQVGVGGAARRACVIGDSF